ncbi:lipoprotein [Pyxidicoccus xibeiensis]|uniref:lipoprotein n=1 Tax=Pyxidicoccus xibeiensis TaxID=2906759 RepID=UPI0020A835F5|nr:lipoprotein [Pyxidicoccus xibeiensis]MCP3144982.1 hypothetical protein [Pyxidicoccus xibeiensis]
MNKYLVVLCLLVAVSGCSKDSVEFSIDNPTAAPISVTIDGTSYEVQPRAARELSLRAGLHSMESATTGKLGFVVYTGTRGGLINPTFSPYLIVNEVYATNATTAKGFRPGEQTVQLDGVDFKGPFVLSDALFIDRTWSYGVHEDFPREIRVGRDSKGNIKSKVFSKDDFIRYVEEAEGTTGLYARSRKATPPPQRHLPQDAPLPTFADPEMESKAAPLKDLYRRYRQATTADEQAALQKAYAPAVQELLPLYAAKARSASREENEKYNELITRVGAALGWSARVVE